MSPLSTGEKRLDENAAYPVAINAGPRLCQGNYFLLKSSSRPPVVPSCNTHRSDRGSACSHTKVISPPIFRQTFMSSGYQDILTEEVSDSFSVLPRRCRGHLIEVKMTLKGRP